MIVVILAIVIVLALVALGSLVFGGRPHRIDEVERFHRARAMTTDWSQQGPVTPVFADEAAIDLTSDQEQHADA